jgi:hypothetical protein
LKKMLESEIAEKYFSLDWGMQIEDLQKKQ